MPSLAKILRGLFLFTNQKLVMKPIHQLFACLLFSFLIITDNKAQLSPTVNIQYRSNLTFPGQDCANIAGYAVNGKEFALVGNQLGVGIVDVTNPTMPQLIRQVTAVNNIWREVKVYDHYAYVTTEGAGQGLQIINLAKLGLAVPTIDLATDVKNYKGPDGDLVSISKLHSLHIDVDKGFLYAFGGSSTVKVGATNTIVSGAIILDIKTDPWNPRYVGKYSTNYIHDGFAINDTLYGAHVYAGYFSIIDFRDKNAPVVLGTKQTINTFTHNTWRSDNGKYLFTTDEKGAAYLASYDVSNPSNIKLLDKIRSPSEANAIVHNTHVLNDFLVTSWYTEGVTIVDAHRPENLVQVGQYDTYNGTGATFNGAWGVYPYLPSGNLIVSNIEDGLFVLTPQYVRACYLEGLITDKSTGQVLSGVAIKINSTDMDKKAVSNISGNYYTGQVTSGTFSVTYSKAGYISQTVNVTLSNGIVTIQNIELVLAIIPVELIELKGQKTEKGAQLTWQTASETGVMAFGIERSTKETPTNFVKIGEIKSKGRSATYAFEDENLISATHYYRLKMISDPSTSTKSEYSKVVSLIFDDKMTIKVTPSVSIGHLEIENGESIEVFNNFGQIVFTKKIDTRFEHIDLSFLPTGFYIVRAGNIRSSLSKKIIISK